MLAAHVDKIDTIDYSTQLSFLTPQIERALEANWQAAQREQERIARTARWLSFVVPSLGVQTSLATLAGTDLERHRAFEAQTREFQNRLREMFYSRMHEQIIRPTPPPLEKSYGRFSFTDYDSIPTFHAAADDASVRVRRAMPQGLTMLVLAVVIALLAAVRLRQWPTDL
jgi:ABC-2 type transport system permease protein